MALLDLVRTKKDLRDYNKVKNFVELVEEHFHLNGTIYDLCCGSGMLGFYILERNKDAFVHFVDNNKTNRFKELSEQSGLSNYEFMQRDLYSLSDLEEGLLLSIHACGKLTEKVISLGLDNELPFAVMTCCHNNELRREYEEMVPSHYLFNMGLKDYVDVGRIRMIRSSGGNAELEDLNIGRKKERVIRSG